MSSYAERLATDLRNAYEAHDREAFERALRRMVDTMTYTGPITERCAKTGEACAHGCRGVCVKSLVGRGDRVTIPHPPGCARKGAAYECTSDAEQAVCMYRSQP